MTAPAPVRPYCPAMIWRDGMDRSCFQVVGLVSWVDHTGVTRHACTRHDGGLRRRYPATVPDRLASHGTLGLGTPWTRAKFPPADLIEVENLIPQGYRINVSAHNGRYGIFDLQAFGPELDPDGRQLPVLRWENRRNPNADARVMAGILANMAAPPVPSMTDWRLADDGTVTVGLDYTEDEEEPFLNLEGEPAFNGAFGG